MRSPNLCYTKLGIFSHNLMPDKPIYCIGSSKQDIAQFPSKAKRKAGF